MNKVFFFVTALFMLGCNSKTTEKAMESANDFDYKSLAKKSMTGDLDFISNSNEQMVLCYQKKNPGESIGFLVIDRTKREIILKQKVGMGGSVVWDGEHQLKLIDPPGMVTRNMTPEDYTYYLDVLTKKKTKGDKK